jgi:diguanylate cyclase (GGDEF)-like protein
VQLIFENELSYLVISILIILSAYILGAFRAASKQKKLKAKIATDLNNKIRLLTRQKDDIYSKYTALSEQTNRYLTFLVNMPEAVKNINSNLSIDDLISSTIRLTTKLIATNEVEIYSFDQGKEMLKLIAALGTNRGERVQFKLGEGVIGGAAATRLFFEKAQLEANGLAHSDEKLEFATPIIFQKELFGVIGIGKIKDKTENDKRFLAMIADLTAVALRNCEYLGVAKEEAITDALTVLYNKKFFIEKAQEAIRKSINYDHVFSILIFDIDHFKHYNDTNGHMQGDVLLRELGKLLKWQTRSTNIAARFGGEEFIVLLQNTDRHKAEVCAENIRKTIEAHPFLHREKQPLGFISISGGIAEFPNDGKSIEELIENADKALYESKKSGRNRIKIYSQTGYSRERAANQETLQSEAPPPIAIADEMKPEIDG